MIKRFYVPTSKLEEGMQIDQVIKDRLDRTLIARGSALDAYLIEGLKKRGIDGVYIKTGEEDPEEKPEEETLTPFVRNKIEKYRTEDPRKVYLSESVKKRVSEGIQYLYNNSDSPEFTNTSAKITNDLIHAIDHNDALAVDISALKTSDEYTFKHSVDVATISMIIARNLGMSSKDVYNIGIAGLLHDMGKSKIPSEILNKPARLTDEEFAIMKTHTLIGYKMCMDDIKLRPYALGPKYHHETLDGMGYPEGLVGNLIPYEDQIIKVADDYDSLVTKRQYKTHIHISDTLKDLIKDTEPNIKVAALDNAAQGVKLGKLNKKVVKALFKVVIDDTYYEISCVTGYVDYLKDQIKRIEQILEYEEKMDKAHSEKKKNYYKEGMEMLFQEGENFENIHKIYHEYQTAYLTRKDIVEKLYEEIRIIKKLQV